MVTIRRKNDSMGTIDVPADRLWGAQTQRSLGHFRISTEKMPVSLIHALALTKRAAAKVNQGLGLLAEGKARAIMQTADEVSADKHRDELPLAIWQTGSGTQSNMNMNEVLANRANELLGGEWRIERKVHPNDDVNKSQGSNGVFPTAVHAAALLALREPLIPQLNVLTKTLSGKSHAFADIVKIGRTHLQGATLLTLNQKVFGWVTMLEHDPGHIENSLPYVTGLALGGTAVGIGLNTHPEYARRIADGLQIITRTPSVTAPNKFETPTTCNALVHAHGTLKGLAASLMRVANDIRWLASGPRCGISEISIPENEPGSSIIPGKINPTQCEALTALCCQVVGNNATINMGGASGSFEFNVYRPMVIHNFLQSVRLPTDGTESLNEHCATGVEPSRERIDQLLSGSLMLVAVLNTHIGYDRAAEIAEKAHEEGPTLKASALALRYLIEAEFDSWVRPELMVGSMRPGS